MLFICVALSITAFPLLARILSELKILHTTVGQITIAAAATDDAIAWGLLVILVAIINNQKSYWAASYVVLISFFFLLFMILIAKPALKNICNRETPTQYQVVAVFTLLLLASCFTQAAGAHSLFGAFLTGLITPHQNNFALQVAQKLEDLVFVLFIPLYFAYSGLNSHLSDLYTNDSWFYMFAAICTASLAKIIACVLAAKFQNLSWRESWAIGFLMNTRGYTDLLI